LRRRSLQPVRESSHPRSLNVSNDPLILTSIAREAVDLPSVDPLDRQLPTLRLLNQLLDHLSSCPAIQEDLMHREMIILERFQDRLATIDGDETISGVLQY